VPAQGGRYIATRTVGTPLEQTTSLGPARWPVGAESTTSSLRRRVMGPNVASTVVCSNSSSSLAIKLSPKPLDPSASGSNRFISMAGQASPFAIHSLPALGAVVGAVAAQELAGVRSVTVAVSRRL
jgi:hypothetical protein